MDGSALGLFEETPPLEASTENSWSASMLDIQVWSLGAYYLCCDAAERGDGLSQRASVCLETHLRCFLWSQTEREQPAQPRQQNKLSPLPLAPPVLNLSLTGVF